jgi:hypothetical protein
MMKETPQEELKRNREFALIAFHAAHGAADMLEIAQQMRGGAEEDGHEEGCSCIEDADRLVESRYCGSEFQVVASSEVECGINPRCSCGSMMKRISIAPQMQASEAVAAVAPMEKRKAAGSAK